jgi:hypothetical protein
MKSSGGFIRLFNWMRRLPVSVLSVALLLAGSTAMAQTPSTPTAPSTSSMAGFGPTGGNVYVLASASASETSGSPATLWAGTARGVFRSEDGGASWAFSSAGIPPTRVQTLAVDPKDAAILYAGTLTPNGVASVGVFKSTDGGASWLDANVGIVDPTTGIGPVDISALAVSPADSRIVVAGGVFSEIFRSGDGGVTWQPTTIGGFSAGLQTTSIVFDPTAPANVYAATTLGLFKSGDGGATWSQAGDAGVPFFCLAIDPTTPRTLYAGDSTGSGVWKSTDGGAHWATANVSLPGAAGARPEILSLAVDPADSSTVYAATYGNGVWVSTNAAGSWSASPNGMRDIRVAALLVASSPTIYAGTYGGGVYVSGDGAASWAKSNEGLRAAMVGAVLADPFLSGVVYAATTDGLSVSADAGESWSEPGSGLPAVTASAIGLVNGHAGASSPTLLAGTLGAGLYQSGDHGGTWTASSGLADSYVSSLAVDPSDPGTVYAGTAHPYTGSNSERIFKSTDGGATWTQTSLDASGFTVDFIGVDPGHSAQLLAGSGGASGLFKSTDGGSTWSTIATGTCGGIAGIAYDAAGAAVYLAGTSGVCRSADGGATWTVATVAGGLAVASVLADPVRPGTVYAGAVPDLTVGIDGGLFLSTDGGVTFTLVDAGIPPAEVGALATDFAAEIVYAGTSGAGVAVFHVPQDREPPSAPSPPSARRPPREVGPR